MGWRMDEPEHGLRFMMGRVLGDVSDLLRARVDIASNLQTRPNCEQDST